MIKSRLANAPLVPFLLTLLAAVAFAYATATLAIAQDQVQSWVPAELEMPADIEVLSDHEIGSSLRMFSFSTESDVDELLTDWEEALSAAGYAIIQGEGDILERVIEFSGQGINNAKIAVAPASADDHNIIEIDATLQ